MRDVSEAARLAAARAGDQHAFGGLIEPYRRELQAHCYRMLGSLQDAEDLVQETLLRAWRKIDSFEGRASFRAWLYKIATNACLNALNRRPRRRLPTTAHPPADPHTPYAPPMDEPIWMEPFPDELLAEASTSPEARYDAHESISLAFLVALQALPPRQRAVLILRDVLDWHAGEVAELLDLTVPAVNSALHRARATLTKHYHAEGLDEVKVSPADERTQALLDRYVRAWEAADLAGLITLLKEDVVFSMPPLPAWYRGRGAVGQFIGTAIFAGAAPGSAHLHPVSANGQPAFAVYQRDDSDRTYRAFAIQVLRCEKEQITEIIVFLNPALITRFGLPAELKM
jgi:RNA polymerase sigma-70 factor (ECF subfamily)